MIDFVCDVGLFIKTFSLSILSSLTVKRRVGQSYSSKPLSQLFLLFLYAAMLACNDVILMVGMIIEEWEFSDVFVWTFDFTQMQGEK